MATRKRSAPAPEMPRFMPPCVNCGEPASIWLRGSNVCYTHYRNVFQIEADRYCDENGLVTIADKMRHVRELGAKPKNPRQWTLNPKSRQAAEMAAEVNAHVMSLAPYIAPPDREPGSDDEG